MSRFLLVTMGARFLAFDADTVRGLLRDEEAGTTEPVTVHGLVYKAVDLADRLALPSEENGPDTRIVLLACEGLQGSIRVAQVRGLLEVDQTQVLPLPQQFQGVERHWYRGVIVLEEDVVLVLNTAWVLQGSGADQGGSSLEWQERAPRFLAVRPGLVRGEAPEC